MISRIRSRDMRRRLITPDERQLFETSIDAPHPVKTAKPIAAGKKRKAPKDKPAGSAARGIQSGDLIPEAKLDLHGLTQNAAHRALLNFFRQTQKRDLRLVLVVTGKGAPKAPGVLKSLVPRWLAEPDFAPFIANIAPAQRRHGGDGAIYVRVRKSAKRG